jgi:hypothetical protein
MGVRIAGLQGSSVFEIDWIAPKILGTDMQCIIVQNRS